MAQLPTLNFSTNWNSKLCCEYFTTIRQSNPSRNSGIEMEVFLKGHALGRVVIVTKVKLRMAAITDFMTCLDTGYPIAEARKIFRKMYPGADDPLMDFILLKWSHRYVSPEQLLTMNDTPEPEPLQLQLNLNQ